MAKNKVLFTGEGFQEIHWLKTMQLLEQFFYQIEPQGNVIILMYHGFTDKTGHDGIANYHGKHLNIQKFEEQIVYLKEHYHVISLPELAASYTVGNKLPARPVVITMDDGYRSNYTLAFLVLKKYGAPAAIFLATDFMDKKAALWVDRLEYALDQTRKEFIEVNLDGRTCHTREEAKRSDLNHNGKYEVIITGVYEAHRHTYLSYDVYGFNKYRLVNADHKFKGFPKFVWMTYKSNDQDTVHLSEKEKQGHITKKNISIRYEQTLK